LTSQGEGRTALGEDIAPRSDAQPQKEAAAESPSAAAERDAVEATRH
jgi:hypothetical protein